jgi:hypothetical protein
MFTGNPKERDGSAARLWHYWRRILKWILQKSDGIRVGWI